MLIIVIDCLKGIQAQTAECIVIGEITTNKAIFALNKIDLIPESERADRIKTVTATLQKTLSRTRFKNAPIVFLHSFSNIDPCICPSGRRKYWGYQYNKPWRYFIPSLPCRWMNWSVRFEEWSQFPIKSILVLACWIYHRSSLLFHLWPLLSVSRQRLRDDRHSVGWKCFCEWWNRISVAPLNPKSEEHPDVSQGNR